MTILETNNKYQLFTFIAACRVWYAVISLSDREILCCCNDYDTIKSEFDKVSK